MPTIKMHRLPFVLFKQPNGNEWIWLGVENISFSFVLSLTQSLFSAIQLFNCLNYKPWQNQIKNNFERIIAII